MALKYVGRMVFDKPRFYILKEIFFKQNKNWISGKNFGHKISAVKFSRTHVTECKTCLVDNVILVDKFFFCDGRDSREYAKWMNYFQNQLKTTKKTT